MLKFFRIPFANAGDRSAIPDPVDVNGFVSFEQGYGFDYQRQKTDPASKNIERDKMNSLFFDVTTAIAEIQAQGIPDFITSVLNGGAAYSYSRFSVVRYDDGGGVRVYQSTADSNTALPTDPTKWAIVPLPANASAIASALSIDLRDIFGNYAHVTGTTNISAIVLREGQEVTLIFDGVLTVINGAALILPSGVNITTSAGFALTLRGESGGVTRAISSSGAAVPISTTGEAQSGTSNTTFITPLRMREGFNASGSAPVYACRAWVNFNGTGTVAIRASGNVSSVTDNGVGDYTINFTTAMQDANYATFGAVQDNVQSSGPIGFAGGTAYTTASARITTMINTGAGTGNIVADTTQVHFGVFR